MLLLRYAIIPYILVYYVETLHKVNQGGKHALNFILELLTKLFFFTGKLSKQSAFAKPLTPEEEAECFEALKQNKPWAMEKLIKHNLRLVAHVAKKYKGSPLEEELISVGSVGLFKAIKTFQPAQGNEFSTYASRCIENEMLMLFRAEKKRQADVSLEESVGKDKDGNDLYLKEVFITDTDSCTYMAELKIIYEQVLAIMKATLTPRDLEIIEYRFGLNGKQPLTQIELSKRMGISRSYISRIENKAILLVRKKAQEKGLSM